MNQSVPGQRLSQEVIDRIHAMLLDELNTGDAMSRLHNLCTAHANQGRGMSSIASLHEEVNYINNILHLFLGSRLCILKSK